MHEDREDQHEQIAGFHFLSFQKNKKIINAKCLFWLIIRRKIKDNINSIPICQLTSFKDKIINTRQKILCQDCK